MGSYILSIDQGTTGTTALLLDKRLNIKARVNREFRQLFPKPGWVEHDFEDIWMSTQHVIIKVLAEAGIHAKSLHAIGITNQRETTVLWDRRTGKPIHNAIVWQCRRTADQCAALKSAGKEPLVRDRTGLVLDPYFSATKIRWLLENVKGAEARARRGELAFGTIDSALVSRLSKHSAHITDVTNASRTLLMDLRKLSWSDELCDLFGVPKEILPEIRGSSGVVAQTKGVKGLPDGIPIAGIAGDQQAALVGQACFTPGEAKCTYGTGAFLLMNVGRSPVASASGLLSTVAWRIGDEVAYALEGSAFIAGAAVQWLRDGLGLIQKSSDIEALARTVPHSNGVVFVPALAGLGAPYWRPQARGLFAGIDRGTKRGHLARAVLEGIAFQIHDLVTAMEKDAGQALPAFRVDGGASMNDLLMQFQSDLLGVPIERPRMIETTALGAAFLAGLGTGFWSSKEEIRKTWKVGKRFMPRMKVEERETHLARWKEMVARA